MSKHIQNYQKSQMFDDVINHAILRKRNCRRKLNISHKINAQSAIVKRYLNDIFKSKINFCKEFGCTCHLKDFIQSDIWNLCSPVNEQESKTSKEVRDTLS